MEELRTGEELERQILEDARRKAAKILEAADRECAGLREEWRRRSAAEAQRQAVERDRRCAELRAELEAQLPLDYLRARLGWIEEMVRGALRAWFASLAPAELRGLLTGRLARAARALAGRGLRVAHGGIDAATARAIVAEAVPEATVEGLEPLANGIGLVLASTDGKLRYRCTVAEFEAQLLEEGREELAVALLGREALSAAGGSA